MVRMLLMLVATATMSMTACAARTVRSTDAPPPHVQLKLAELSRVWVAGFTTERNPEFDLNTETVRLLRTQLRTWSSAKVIEVEPLTIDSEHRLSDVPYWRRLGEE